MPPHLRPLPVRSVQMTAQTDPGQLPQLRPLIPSLYQTRAILPGAVLQVTACVWRRFARAQSSGIIR